MFGFICVTCFLSMWLSNTATTAMLIPILEAVLNELERQKEMPDILDEAQEGTYTALHIRMNYLKDIPKKITVVSANHLYCSVLIRFQYYFLHFSERITTVRKVLNDILPNNQTEPLQNGGRDNKGYGAVSSENGTHTLDTRNQ